MSSWDCDGRAGSPSTSSSDGSLCLVTCRRERKFCIRTQGSGNMGTVILESLVFTLAHADTYTPLNCMASRKACIEILRRLTSGDAILGFEFILILLAE